MPTLNIDSTAMDGSTGSYSKANGPGAGASAGEIDCQGSSASAAVDIAWTLADGLNNR